MVNVGKYIIHGSYGIYDDDDAMNHHKQTQTNMGSTVRFKKIHPVRNKNPGSNAGPNDDAMVPGTRFTPVHRKVYYIDSWGDDFSPFSKKGSQATPPLLVYRILMMEEIMQPHSRTVREI